ncbi:hypothetical protein ACSBR1_022656 [Camellia fascicularis]
MFMENHGSCEDMGPSAFPVEEVHKISVLDIRMANADRHAWNILMSKGEDGRTVLIPIDHGYCFPESFEDCTFDWLYWPQARKPYNADTIEYIKSLDAEEDIALLNLYGWDLPLECAHAPYLHHASKERGGARAYSLCHRKHHVQGKLEEGICDRGDCPRSIGFCAPWHKRSRFHGSSLPH